MVNVDTYYNAGQYEKSIPLYVPLIDGLIISSLLFFIGFYYWKGDLNLWLHIWTGWYLVANLLACLFYFSALFIQISIEPAPCNPFKGCVRPIVSWMFVMLGLLMAAYLTRQTEEFSRKIITGWFVLTPVFLLVWRILFFRYLASACMVRDVKTVVIGNSEQAKKIACFLKTAPFLATNLVGYYRAVNYEEDNKFPCSYSIDCLGDINKCIEDARKGRFDLAYLCISVEHYSYLTKIIEEFSDTTVSLYFVLPPSLFPNVLRPCWQFLAGNHMLSIYESSVHGINDSMKRLEDVIFASIILAIIALPMLVIAALVKFTSRGPVLFSQKRYGLNGREFKMYKFRTMYAMEDGPDIKQATKDDPRVTPVGRVLRKFSLDELPQFINVLKGDMSIVGPRPHAVAHNEEYRKLVPNYMLRHKVKPGITGLAQINGCRGETDTTDKMAARVHYDLEYIRSWSLLLDIKIILLSVVKGFYGQNAY